MNRTQRLLVILGLLISVVFLWLAFRDLQPGAVIDELGRINLAWLAAGALVYFLAVLVITRRWGFLLAGVQRVRTLALFPLVCIGYMGNNVYPFRSGEALRVFLLRRDHGVPIVKGAVTVAVERVFDGIVMLSFILVALLFSGVVSEDVANVLSVAAPVVIAALLVFFVLAARPDWLKGMVEIVQTLLPERLGGLVRGASEDIIHGLEALRSPVQLLGAVFTSYLTWMIEAGVYWMVGQAFDLDMGYTLALLVVGTVNLAALLPTSPGQIGVFEFFASAVLVAAGIEEAVALSYAIVVHVTIWLPVTLVGFFFLVREGLNLRAVARAHDLEAQLADVETPAASSQPDREAAPL